jgi:predicted dehydrogenase
VNSDAKFPTPVGVPLRGSAVATWGVIAPGAIANDFVLALRSHTEQSVRAVASRSPERAAAFATMHGIPVVHSSYEALVDDPAIDIVYIAAPHSAHLALAMLAISAGKHVLIEKPMATNATDARRIADAAHAAGVFAMEAMWPRFLPQTSVIEQLMADGALGDVQLVVADYGSRTRFDPSSRVFAPELGGGALLDIGMYPAWLAHFVLGDPASVSARGSFAPTGVDSQASLIIQASTPKGAQALVSTSLLVTTPAEARIHGTRAHLHIDGPFLMPGGFTLTGEDGATRQWHDGSGLRGRDGLAWQAVAVAQDIADGRIESSQHPLARSVSILETIDAARAQLHVN